MSLSDMSKNQLIYAKHDAERKGDFAMQARIVLMLAQFDSK